VPVLAVSFPREDDVHLSPITAALGLLLSVVTIGRFSDCRVTLFLILFRKVNVKQGQSPLESIEGLRRNKKSVNIEPKQKKNM
jgi:hypothetical protein